MRHAAFASDRPVAPVSLSTLLAATLRRVVWRAIVLLVLAPASAIAQDADTRAETLQREREEKAKKLEKPEPNRLEKFLLNLESGRLFERLLNPAEGLYPKIGNITPGSGFAGGPGYRNAGLFDGQAVFSTFGAMSIQKYWMIDARFELPHLAGDRLWLDAHGQVYDFPDEDYFGIGPDSRREDFVTYGLSGTTIGGTGRYRPTRWFSVGGGIDFMTPEIDAENEPGKILSLFNDGTAPGVLEQPDFIRYEAIADLNYREPRGNPRSGGRYALSLQRFDDRDTGRYSFDRVEVDLQQYIPLLKDRRVLALHALASMSDADTGAEVPFYFQRTLGGPDDLRGFRRFRFRDTNVLLLQAEYRWEIFTAVDGAIFYDAGNVASHREDLRLNNLETDYGIGFRFGTRNGVFLRIEGAFGSDAGKHFILRFGHVF